MRIIYTFILLTFLSCSNLKYSEADIAIDPIDFLSFVLNDTTDIKISTNEFDVISDISILPPPTFQRGTRSSFLAEILDEPDTLFIKEQLKQSRYFRTDKLAEHGFPIVKISEISSGLGIDWDSIFEKQIQTILTIDRPIFNKSYTKAYLRIGYTCGHYCGSGQDIVLERIDNRWSLKEIIGFWIS